MSPRYYVSCGYPCGITMAGTIVGGYFWTDWYNNEAVISDIAIIFSQLYLQQHVVVVKTTHVIDEVYLKGYVTDGDKYWLLMICHFVLLLVSIGYIDTNFVSFDDDIDYISNIASNNGDNNSTNEDDANYTICDIIKYGGLYGTVYMSGYARAGALSTFDARHLLLGTRFMLLLCPFVGVCYLGDKNETFKEAAQNASIKLTQNIKNIMKTIEKLAAQQKSRCT